MLPDFTLVEATAADIRAALRAGTIGCRELIAACLHRIAAHDRQGPCLNAVITINPDALAQAERLDREAAAGRWLPLHGVPVIVKDVVATADHMPTTGGSLALLGLTAPADAAVVERLRTAGAVVVAKANLDELTMGGTGASAVGGQTRNPYAPRHSPGGSSGGTAVAIAASYGVLGIGTDTCGSVRSPAACNNLVGVRPTLGLVSCAGVMPAARTSDTVGPMTRTVADAAALLDAIAADGHVSALRADALGGARIGVVRHLFGDDADPEARQVNALIETAIEDLLAAGATIVDPVHPPHIEKMRFADLPYRGTYEMQAQFDAYLAELGDAAPVPTYAAIARIGSPLATIQAGLERNLRHASLRDPEYVDLVRRGTAWSRAGIDAALREHRLDALLHPTRRRPPEPAGTLDLDAANGILSAVSGYPALTVPAGFTADGRPVGVELLGPPRSEPTLFGLAYAYERATGHRRAPAL